MNRLLLFFIFILTLPSTFAQPIEERMAVLELKNKAGFSREEVEYLSSLLRRLASSELAQSFIVYDKENITELLPPDVNLEDCEGQCAVETGRNINATYIITGTIIRFGKNLRISIDLHDTRSGRLIGSEVASGKDINDMESGIQEAGGRLLRKLMKGPKVNSKAKSTRKVIGETSTTLVGTSNKRVIATLLSEPRGAAVMIDGVQKCSEGKEVCKVELTEGAHQLSMSKTDYFIRSGSVTITKDNNSINWSLDPSFARLKVVTNPASLSYKINDEVHQSGLTRKISSKKVYKILSNDPCYAKQGEEVQVANPGEEILVNLSPSPIYAMIDVSARSSRGEPINAEIYVDGDKIGVTPSQHKVSVCAKSLILKHHAHGEINRSLLLKEGETKTVSVVVNNILLPSEIITDYRGISGLFTLAGVGNGIWLINSIKKKNDDHIIYSSIGLGVSLLLDMFILIKEAENEEKARVNATAMEHCLWGDLTQNSKCYSEIEREPINKFFNVFIPVMFLPPLYPLFQLSILLGGVGKNGEKLREQIRLIESIYNSDYDGLSDQQIFQVKEKKRNSRIMYENYKEKLLKKKAKEQELKQAELYQKRRAAEKEAARKAKAERLRRELMQ